MSRDCLSRLHSQTSCTVVRCVVSVAVRSTPSLHQNFMVDLSRSQFDRQRVQLPFIPSFPAFPAFPFFSSSARFFVSRLTSDKVWMEWRERVVKSCSFFNLGISTVWCREARRSRVLDNFVRLESPISGLVKELWGSDSSENVSFSCLLVDPGPKIAKKIDVL